VLKLEVAKQPPIHLL